MLFSDLTAKGVKAYVYNLKRSDYAASFFKQIKTKDEEIFYDLELTCYFIESDRMASFMTVKELLKNVTFTDSNFIYECVLDSCSDIENDAPALVVTFILKCAVWTPETTVTLLKVASQSVAINSIKETPITFEITGIGNITINDMVLVGLSGSATIDSSAKKVIGLTTDQWSFYQFPKAKGTYVIALSDTTMTVKVKYRGKC